MHNEPKANCLGKTKDEEDVSGTITVPEVAHDTEENEYVVCLFVPKGASYGTPDRLLVRHRHLL